MRKNRFKNRIFALLLIGVMLLPSAVFAADETAPAALGGLSIEENPMGTVNLKWNAFAGADHYEIASPGVNGGAAAGTNKTKCKVSGLDHGEDYDFTVDAFDADGNNIARGTVSITTEPYRIKFNESKYRVLSSKTVKPKKLKINLTKMIKEPNSGYAVVQGGCTDGKYAYYLMVSSSTQKGRVLKVRIKDNKVIKRSKVLNTCHGNGMAYDKKRKQLVVVGREKRKQELTVIDAKTLKVTKRKNVRYNNKIDAGSSKLNDRYKQSGLAAIAYVKKYDCYVAFERIYHNLLIFDPDTFECIGLAYTNLGSANPGTFQAMDADEKYVYLLLSYYKSGNVVQPYNKIVAVDWNSENLLPVVNACKSKDPKFVEKAWFCKNDSSGKPDASIRIKTKHEAENIYHTKDKEGREHFYMAEYYSHNIYKTVKVRVRVNGKWKWKKKKVFQYMKRDNHVYDLCII